MGVVVPNRFRTPVNHLLLFLLTLALLAGFGAVVLTIQVLKGGEQTVRFPTGFKIIAKTEEYLDPKSGKPKRKSPQTKNEMIQEMIQRHRANLVKFKYILADSWYSSSENTRYIKKKGNVFLFEQKENRLITDSESKRNQGYLKGWIGQTRPKKAL